MSFKILSVKNDMDKLRESLNRGMHPAMDILAKDVYVENGEPIRIQVTTMSQDGYGIAFTGFLSRRIYAGNWYDPEDEVFGVITLSGNGEVNFGKRG